MHIVYETTNLINGKKYIGIHGIKNSIDIKDTYLGSGVLNMKAGGFHRRYKDNI